MSPCSAVSADSAHPPAHAPEPRRGRSRVPAPAISRCRGAKRTVRRIRRVGGVVAWCRAVRLRARALVASRVKCAAERVLEVRNLPAHEALHVGVGKARGAAAARRAGVATARGPGGGVGGALGRLALRTVALGAGAPPLQHEQEQRQQGHGGETRAVALGSARMRGTVLHGAGAGACCPFVEALPSAAVGRVGLAAPSRVCNCHAADRHEAPLHTRARTQCPAFLSSRHNKHWPELRPRRRASLIMMCARRRRMATRLHGGCATPAHTARLSRGCTAWSLYHARQYPPSTQS